MKKAVSVLALFLLCIGYAFAQNQRDPVREYEEFLQKATKKYSDFRDNANAEYAKFMREAWKEFGAEPPVPVPPSPDPPIPPVAEPDEKPSSDSIPFEIVISPLEPVLPPKPVAPIQVTPIPVLPAPKATTPGVTPPRITPPDVPVFSFYFYGTECQIRLENKQRILLSNVSEAAIADAWEKLSGAGYNPAIADCLHLREDLKLCDWGYYQLLKTIADEFYGMDRPNESILLQAFILTQSGYKVRMARTDNRLAVLVPFDHSIYTYSYLTIEGEKYYILNKDLLNSQFYVCNYAFPQEQTFSLQLRSQPEFSDGEIIHRTFAAARYPIQAEVETNQNLIDFLDSYPKTSEWNLYSKASLSEAIKEQLYPVLKNSIAGKSQTDATNLLINFVQTAFKYQTDAQQFGYERPFFADESFYYPANDCEDRSILFSILVKELMGLDAVLLYYPNHLATAVRFDENVEGDYLTIDGHKYIICDPTFINANIGREMPSLKDSKPKVIKI